MFLTAGLYAQDKKVTEIKTNQLPKAVTDFIQKNMPGAIITRAGKIEDKNETTYAAVLEHKGTKHSYIFDKDGKLVGKGDHLLNSNTKIPATKPAAAGTVTDPKAVPATNPPVKANSK